VIIEREVLIIGAGPTGCVVATLLARHGHQVLLVSDDGREGGLPVETMIPGASRTFERLGWSHLLEESTPHSFLHPGPSRRGRCWGNSMLDIQPLERSQRGWRFLRPGLDHWLQEQAVQAGVELRKHTRASGPLPSSGQGPVALSTPDRSSVTVDAKLVIAATGRSSAPPFLPVEIEERLPETIALSTIVEDVSEETDISIIEAVVHGWIWWLPLGDGRASLALLCDPAEVKALGRADIWKRAIQSVQGPARNCSTASTRGTPATARLNSISTGLLLAGDAISAIDPLSSQGLEKALVSAEATALAARTVLLGDASAATMGDHRQRWERGLFRIHRQRALDLYRSETRFPEAPFWQARHALVESKQTVANLPVGLLCPSPQLQRHPRWVAAGDRLVRRDGYRLASSDEESIDHFGSVPTAALIELIGDQLPMNQLHPRASKIAPLVQQSPATLTTILGEMCRLGWLIEKSSTT
jgi:flavin-dependent dehydrogenase